MSSARGLALLLFASFAVSLSSKEFLMSIFNKTLHPPLCSRKYCLLSSIPQQRAPTHSGAAAPCTETERANPEQREFTATASFFPLYSVKYLYTVYSMPTCLRPL